eukprot:scaffold10658_cov189-Ochromonas_danica.AAC.1
MGGLVGSVKSLRENWRYFVVMMLITVGNVAMSGFKLLWCRILFLVLSRCVARRGGGGVKEGVEQQKSGVVVNGGEACEDNEAGGSCLSKNTEEEGNSKKKEEEKKVNSRSGWDSATISIYSSLMLFNTIVAPCLATLLISSDCFYYVFTSPPSVSVSYTYPRCTTVYGTTCSATVEAVYVSDFQPPFSYSYQCSSALLQEY